MITALTTIRDVSAWTRRLNLAALVVGLALSVIEIVLAFKALTGSGGMINGVPFFMLFFLAGVTALAVIGDVRVMRTAKLRGPRRLARHLWRMCFALFIAAGSFFFDSRTRRESSSRAIYDPCDARALDSVGVCGHVLLAMASPRPTKRSLAKSAALPQNIHRVSTDWARRR
ncbi:MAG TPA: hypothetical protein VKB88_27520 [Bryobacteraceae bacterium]|nr:hypothetical protein [Bryobacteraceae bacterium]